MPEESARLVLGGLDLQHRGKEFTDGTVIARCL